MIWPSGGRGPMLVVSAGIGVIIPILLGGGLVAAGFPSSNSSHDERAAGATAAPAEEDE